MNGSYDIVVGDCRAAALPAGWFHACVTSPPYFGLRDYNVDGQIGLEASPDEFVAAMRSVFGGKDNPVGVWRALRDDGVLWLNLGDSYCAGQGGRQTAAGELPHKQRTGESRPRKRDDVDVMGWSERAVSPRYMPARSSGLKPKDLMGMPWRVAFALQADGWYLRSEVVWAKPSPMPESVRDRCVCSHEFVFQLAKRPRYYFDMEAVKETGKGKRSGNKRARTGDERGRPGHHVWSIPYEPDGGGCAPRDVWTIASEPAAFAFCLACRVYYDHTRGLEKDGEDRPICRCGRSDAWLSHFAMYPTALVRRCVLASTSEKGCCGKCGAPIERVVEREARTRARPNDYVKRSGEAGTGNSCANTVDGVDVRTVGWRATCECGKDAVSSIDYHQQTATTPCRVLDPFGGAGTTAIAACQLGRDCTLVELNSDYVEMARHRIDRALRGGLYRSDDVGDAPLFAEVTA